MCVWISDVERSAKAFAGFSRRLAADLFGGPQQQGSPGAELIITAWNRTQ
jgi:hypothetical protein